MGWAQVSDGPYLQKRLMCHKKWAEIMSNFEL
jgi:hypothetical protein